MQIKYLSVARPGFCITNHMMLDYVRNRQQNLVDLSSCGTKSLARPFLGLFVLFLMFGVLSQAAIGAGRSSASETDLVRLSEILGAVHHLREVCNANEGQLWRMKMQELLKLEAPANDLKELMIARFNRTYHQHRLAYPRCTGQARTDISRFLDEGAALSQLLAAKSRG
jgi:uncharacterized protein (TIGR02301 family)